MTASRRRSFSASISNWRYFYPRPPRGGRHWSAATKEVLVQKLAAYENTGYEPDEIRAAIEQAAKNSETKTATIMAECIAGAMKDTLEKYGTAGSGKKGETP